MKKNNKNMSLIRVKNIEKTYHVGTVETKVLKGVSLEIQKGEFVAIMGPSGSGKSTLMNLMGFLDSPTAGEYYFDSIKVEDFDEEALAEIRNKKIGFVFQQFYLLPKLSALDNVKLPMIYAHTSSAEQDQKALKSLEAVGLGERVHHKPNELSGGQQQRVSIARALVNEPKVIFADEPTGNLDTKSGEEVMKIFCELNKQGKTIIMVTHDPEVAEYTDRIIVIKDGLVLEDKINKHKK